MALAATQASIKTRHTSLRCALGLTSQAMLVSRYQNHAYVASYIEIVSINRALAITAAIAEV